MRSSCGIAHLLGGTMADKNTTIPRRGLPYLVSRRRREPRQVASAYAVPPIFQSLSSRSESRRLRLPLGARCAGVRGAAGTARSLKSRRELGKSPRRVLYRSAHVRVTHRPRPLPFLIRHRPARGGSGREFSV